MQIAFRSCMFQGCSRAARRTIFENGETLGQAVALRSVAGCEQTCRVDGIARRFETDQRRRVGMGWFGVRVRAAGVVARVGGHVTGVSIFIVDVS
jgi:hypothetical protein